MVQGQKNRKNDERNYRYYNFMIDGKPTSATDMIRIAASFHAKSDDGAITVENAMWALSELGYMVDTRRKS